MALLATSPILIFHMPPEATMLNSCQLPKVLILEAHSVFYTYLPGTLQCSITLYNGGEFIRSSPIDRVMCQVSLRTCAPFQTTFLKCHLASEAWRGNYIIDTPQLPTTYFPINKSSSLSSTCSTFQSFKPRFIDLKLRSWDAMSCSVYPSPKA